MFGSLLKSVKSAAGSFAENPQAAAAAAIALNRYKETGSFLVQDSFIEERVIPSVEAYESVDSAALFGFRDHIRVLVRARVMKQEVEATLLIRPVGIVWEENQHSMSFSYEIERIEALSTSSKLGHAVLKKAVEELLPFAGIISAVAEYAIGRSVKTMGLAAIDSWEGLQDQGVRFEGQLAIVDLEKQPALAPLWLRPDLSTVRWGPIAEKLGSTPPSVASMLTPTKLHADREGLYLDIELSPLAKGIFEMTAGAWDTGKALISGWVSK